MAVKACGIPREAGTTRSGSPIAISTAIAKAQIGAAGSPPAAEHLQRPQSRHILSASRANTEEYPMRVLVSIIALSVLVVACAPPAATTTPAPPPAAEHAPFELLRPNVTLEADPPPPFTYWAPEGSTIRNHGNPGLWVAYLNGRQIIYFGDACRASEWQRYVGEPLSSLPPAPEGMILRTYCTTCAKTDDLRQDRINVVFEQSTQVITEIACH